MQIWTNSNTSCAFLRTGQFHERRDPRIIKSHYHDLVIQETAPSNVIASLRIGQAHVEPIKPSPWWSGRPLAECRDPRLQHKAHLCRIQFQQKEIRVRRSCHFELQFLGKPQRELISEGDNQTRESHHKIFDGTSQLREQTSRKRSRKIGIWKWATLEHNPNVDNETSQ